MRNLYARFVLFLIRPALDLRTPFDAEAAGTVVIDTMLKDLHRNGPVSRTMKGGA